MCPDFGGLSLAGWQGRIIGVEQTDDGETCVGIRWDSATLAAMPDEYIADSEEQGCDCVEMYLRADEVESTRARDTEEEARHCAGQVQRRGFWLGMGARGKRVLDVVGETDPDDAEEMFEAWETHLKRALTFPLDAKVSEPQDRGRLAMGDNVQVLAITDVDDLRGVLVRIKCGWRKRDFPLCDLEIVPRKSPAYLPVEDYCVWFANR